MKNLNKTESKALFAAIGFAALVFPAISAADITRLKFPKNSLSHHA